MAARRQDSLLSIEELTADYGVGPILDGLSMTVGRGELVSLVGRNGAGKTTTLRCVMGRVPSIGGRIRHDGQDITGLPPDETARRGIAYVPEERRVFPGLTVRENLELAWLGGVGGDRSVADVLDLFENLRENEQAYGAELSGGEQQMLVIGRALVSGADLLLLDEPTEGLAPAIVDRVVETIRQLNREGITVLLVEQNVNVALALADYHYVLDKGAIAFEGDGETLRENRDVLERHMGVSTLE